MIYIAPEAANDLGAHYNSGTLTGLGELDPLWHLINSSLIYPSEHPKRYLDRFSGFHRAQEGVQHTDRQTTLLRLKRCGLYDDAAAADLPV